MIRLVDFLLSGMGCVVLFPVFVLIYIIGLFDTGQPIFKQVRVGKDRKLFVLYKFRTMSVDTASVASHLASSTSITKLGSFLRRTKLDELPQLINVFRGDMSLVGPRPNLDNQIELVELRDILGVYKVRPGITGLAQVNNIDMSQPKLLAETDAIMIRELTLKIYFKLIFSTVLGGGNGDAVK
ncbi:sugar transferase [Enterovibrio norvegicus]|uniref:sugar transferase n=1 Tax=Enterovibrio norvegicus TaxID=188144 RepID=UPI00352D6636